MKKQLGYYLSLALLLCLLSSSKVQSNTASESMDRHPTETQVDCVSLAIFVGSVAEPAYTARVEVKDSKGSHIYSRHWYPFRSARSEIADFGISYWGLTLDSQISVVLHFDKKIKSFTPYGNLVIKSGGAIGQESVELTGRVRDFVSLSTSIGIVNL